MADHVYKPTRSPVPRPRTSEEAIANAIVKAPKSLHNLRWFEVVETRGEIEGAARRTGR